MADLRIKLTWERLIGENQNKNLITCVCGREPGKLSNSQGGESIPCYPSWLLVAGLIIKLIQDRLTGEKETNFISCAWRSHRNGTYEVARIGSFYVFLDKEMIKLWGIDRTKKLKLWVLN